ncbi:MAG: CBS domain-containing protein [Candidatus Roizmanbacteria bacterium]
MLYYSQQRNKQIYSDTNTKIGELSDLVFLTSGYPNITKIVMKNNRNKMQIIPTKYIKKFNQDVVVDHDFHTSTIANDEVEIGANLLDKQIIDLGKNKVVRVNDVIIQEKIVDNAIAPYIIGVDIGIAGLLRRLKLEDSIAKFLHVFDIHFSSSFLSWADLQPIDLADGRVHLKTEQEKLKTIHPEDLADYLEKTSIENVKGFISQMDKKHATKVIKNLNITYKREIFQQWTPQEAVQFIDLFDDDDIVDILMTLTKIRREEILNLLSAKKQKEVKKLLEYTKTSVGRRMTTECLCVSSVITAKEALDNYIIHKKEGNIISILYALNQEEQLVGVVHLSEVVAQQKDTPIYKFMNQNVIEIRLTTPIDIAIKQMLKYNLNALPVLDKSKKVLGVVTIDDVSDIILRELYE